ncbi:MAG TPA: gfo/Idh/MocA family oxidoreductase, partial [Acidobacteriota bacterium]|nr:gfo/Idh/MocA family oxidoreductase [Acidobacteriota bacterium]
ETFYDGYVVNAIMDAAYESVRSRQWAPVLLEEWRGVERAEDGTRAVEHDEAHTLIKEEKMPDGRKKLILRENASGRVVQKIIE